MPNHMGRESNRERENDRAFRNGFENKQLSVGQKAAQQNKTAMQKLVAKDDYYRQSGRM